MQGYPLNKGRKGFLVSPDGSFSEYQLSENKFLDRDDILMDPIRLYNDKRQGFYKAPVTEFDKVVEKMALNGYTVFKQPGKTSKLVYGFATILAYDPVQGDE